MLLTRAAYVHQNSLTDLCFVLQIDGQALPRRSGCFVRGGEVESLKVMIYRLRQKIEPDPARPHYLLTERGVGY